MLDFRVGCKRGVSTASTTAYKLERIKNFFDVLIY